MPASGLGEACTDAEGYQSYHGDGGCGCAADPGATASGTLLLSVLGVARANTVLLASELRRLGVLGGRGE